MKGKMAQGPCLGTGWIREGGPRWEPEEDQRGPWPRIEEDLESVLGPEGDRGSTPRHWEDG